MKRVFTIFLPLFLGFAAMAQQTGYFTTQFSWTNSNGLQNRSLRVLVPTSYNASNSYALVIGFHGHGDSPNNYIQVINYYATNSYYGKVILACPNEGTPSTSWFSGTEDFKIISAIINHLKATYNIDTNMVIAQGFSFGGKSAYLHGLDEADYLKGIIAHSPGFYNTADINNTCTDPLHCQHKYNYGNSWKLMACITAGSGEYNLGLTEPYLTLASKAAIKLNNTGGDAIFIEVTGIAHSLPPQTTVRTCWDHVTKPSTGTGDILTIHDFIIYPNPANDFLKVEGFPPGGLKALTIINISGEVVSQVTFREEELTVPVSYLAEGIYLVRVSDDEGRVVLSKKIVIKR